MVVLFWNYIIIQTNYCFFLFMVLTAYCLAYIRLTTVSGLLCLFLLHFWVQGKLHFYLIPYMICREIRGCHSSNICYFVESVFFLLFLFSIEGFLIFCLCICLFLFSDITSLLKKKNTILYFLIQKSYDICIILSVSYFFTDRSVL